MRIKGRRTVQVKQHAALKAAARMNALSAPSISSSSGRFHCQKEKDLDLMNLRENRHHNRVVCVRLRHSKSVFTVKEGRKPANACQLGVEPDPLQVNPVLTWTTSAVCMCCLTKLLNTAIKFHSDFRRSKKRLEKHHKHASTLCSFFTVKGNTSTFFS